MRLLIGMAVLGLCLGTANAKDGWKSFIGKEFPSFRVEGWLNTDGAEPQPRQLKGKVWMVEILSVG